MCSGNDDIEQSRVENFPLGIIYVRYAYSWPKSSPVVPSWPLPTINPYTNSAQYTLNGTLFEFRLTTANVHGCSD